MVTRRQFIQATTLAAAGAYLTGAPRALSAQSPRTDNFFALNTQDFAYPQPSAELVWRVIDLHESLDVPIDISLTTTMVDIYEAQYMDLLRRLFTSRVVCLSYHRRPPLPYHADFDWLGMSRRSSEQQRSTIYNYETHGLDLVAGQPTLAAGGYAKLVSLAGYAAPSVEGGRAPFVVGIKMHDNDFFAEDSAWTTVYLAKGARQGPPWNTALKSALLSADAQRQMWSVYESTVRYEASIRSRVPIANSRDWQRLVGLGG